MIQRWILLSALLGLNFMTFSQTLYSIVISEVMPDPSPEVQLPPYEYIELYNCSSDTINMNGWKLGAGNDVSVIRENRSLYPGKFLIICRASSVDYFKDLGDCIGITSFPSLDNEQEIIYIQSPIGKTIHAIPYNSAWHSNGLKKNGGWSLEMIDLRSPCTFAFNWASSIDNSGGTPGRINSVNSGFNDTSSPFFAYAYMLDSINLLIEFNEPVDSMNAASRENYLVDNASIKPGLIEVLPPLFDKCLIRLSDAVLPGTIFSVSGKNIPDCRGNLIEAGQTISTGVPLPPMPADLVINEIMFNPSVIGRDYIEIYNHSAKPVDIRKLYIATIDIAGNITGHVPFTDQPRVLLPGEYIVVSNDAIAVAREFPYPGARHLYSIKNLPSMPDDKGTVILTGEQGNIIDEVRYSKDWHLPFISNQDGLSLERIDPSGPSNDPGNWTSAGTLVKGTPGYKNSQWGSLSNSMNGTMWIERKVFSPDGDGHEDLLMIRYKFPSPGTMVSIRVYDSSGHLVSFPLNNALLGVSGMMKWDGNSINNEKLPVGIYIIQATCFNENGKGYKFTQAVTLARKVN